jgi:sigma-B regulation protein RsbU (phosphoserine phosphatase)
MEKYCKHIRLSNDVQEIPLLNAFVDEICEFNGLDEMTTMQMNLAIEEAVVNVMNYAYPEGTKGFVDITSMSDEESLQFVISDNGKPFDPTTKEEVDTTLPVEKRRIGGLGIFLVRKMMDNVKYEYKDGQNILTLRKKSDK